MKMRIIPFILCLALLLLASPFTPHTAAFGTADAKMTVTHANVACVHEGSAVIYTPQSASTIASYGTFQWWYIAVFEWNSEQNAYVVTKTDTSINDKSATVIPENGFVYAVCVGNDYPALYASDPTTYAGYKDYPNYINAPTRDSHALLSTLKKGDKAYCYGGDFLNGRIKTNNALWYSEEFSSDTYIKIGEPEQGKKAFDPIEAKKEVVGYKLGVHQVNKNVVEGQSVIYTPAWSTCVRKSGSYSDYAWCRLAVFDWNDDEGAYEVISVSTAVGSNVPKDAVIPQNGFVLSVNLGNDYSGTGGLDYTNPIADNTYKSLVSITPGDLAYVAGIDIKAGTVSTGTGSYFLDSFKTDGYIYINLPPEDGAVYKPDISVPRLQTPTLTAPEQTVPDTGATLTWEAVEGAEKYLVSLADTSSVMNGEFVFFNKQVTETTLSIDASQYKKGHSYTASVVAIASGKRDSFVASRSFYVVKESAFSSIFATAGKKVVAFGDSLTAFTGWVTMMRSEIGVEVINAGIGGNTTIHAIARVKQDVIDLEPDVVIMNFGMNDAARNLATNKGLVPLDDYEENMRSMAQDIIDSGSALILVTPHHVCTAPNYYAPGYGLDYADAAFDDYIAVIKKIASDLGVGLIDINNLAKSEVDTEFCALGDGVHQSAYGHEKYCEWISKYLLENFDSEDDFPADVSEPPVVESTPETSGPETSKPEESDKFNPLLLIVCGCVIITAIVAVILIKNKKK